MRQSKTDDQDIAWHSIKFILGVYIDHPQIYIKVRGWLFDLDVVIDLLTSYYYPSGRSRDNSLGYYRISREKKLLLIAFVHNYTFLYLE